MYKIFCIIEVPNTVYNYTSTVHQLTRLMYVSKYGSTESPTLLQFQVYVDLVHRDICPINKFKGHFLSNIIYDNSDTDVDNVDHGDIVDHAAHIDYI